MKIISDILNATVVIGMLALSLQTSPHAEPTEEHYLGADDYINNCADCHGVDGKGNGPMTKQLAMPPKDLTLLSKKKRRFIS